MPTERTSHQPHTPGYESVVSPQKQLLLGEARSLKPTWILYASVFTAMLNSIPYGWSNSQINYSVFNNVKDCNRRPVKEGTCLMFPGHTKLMWIYLVNAWIVGGMVGSFVSGTISNKFGRRAALRYNTVIMVIGCIVQIIAPTAWTFTVGRFIAGISNGIAMAVVNTYLSEISTPHNRHALGINTHLSATLGILGVATTFWYWGTKHGFRYIAAMPILMAAGHLLLSHLIMPESPVWLVTRGRDAEAEDAIGRLYGEENVPTMMAWIQAVDRRSKLPSVVGGRAEVQKSEGLLAILTAAKYRRAVIIAFGLTCINQLVGINAIFFYSSSILKSSGIKDSRVGIMIIDILNVVPVPIAAILSKYLRKRLMLISGLFVVMLCCIGMTFALTHNIGWFSVTMLGLYVVGYDLSIGPLFWPIIGELFPDAARGNAVGLCIMLKWFCALIVGVGFPYVQEDITNYSFTPFLGMTVFAIIFIYFMVPETSDLTIAEIQQGFRNSEMRQSESRKAEK